MRVGISADTDLTAKQRTPVHVLKGKSILI
jgi:hypothetical protein